MNAQRWRQIKETLQQALELRPEARRAFLDQACSDDHDLRAEVESLLRSSEEVQSGFLRSSFTHVTLSKGSKLGEFEVRTLIGSGGMGEVYRARDPLLDRDVAIKILPRFYSTNPERVRRFRQEAQAAASLNHPNILSVFQFGSHDDAEYFVCELLEGDTLRDRIREGPPTFRTAVDYAIQIAHGLSAAHEKGIVHRDLKPENVFVTKDGHVKILDFGLAKLSEAELPAEPPSVANTESGIILGTAGYMSPEQVRGQSADHRSDVFALGAVLYEMLSGRGAFRRQCAADTMSAILNVDPPFLADLVPGISPALARIVHSCLEKNPVRRFQSATDLAFALEALTGTSELPAVRAPRRFRALFLAAPAAALLLLSAAVTIYRSKTLTTPEPPAPVRFSISLPGDDTINPYLGSSVAFSPDGRRIAYVVNHAAVRSIFVRSLDSAESIPLAGTEGATRPFFSPDGAWVAFFSFGKLRKVPTGGGRAIIICESAVSAAGSWGPDDTIVFTPNFNYGLFLVSANGGTPRRLTAPDVKQGTFHVLPQFIPGKREVLFTIWNGSESLDSSRIAVLSLDTGKWREIMEGGWAGRYSPAHLLFVRGNSLLALPFDWDRLTPRGSATAVVEGVFRDFYDVDAHYAVAQNGALAFVSDVPHAFERSLVWVNRNGVRQSVSSQRYMYSTPRLSPDGSKIAFWLVKNDVVANIWSYDVARDTLNRLTFGVDDHTVAWSPDGRNIAFESSRSGAHQVYIQPVDSSSAPVAVTSGNKEHYLCDWSPDGRHLAYVEWSVETGGDIWTVDVGPPGAFRGSDPRPVTTTPFLEKQAAFSPDGKWLAFTSDESGQNEVYVQPFPGPGPKRQISVGGGQEPGWSHSGQELFYRRGGQMLGVRLHHNATDLLPDRPKPLFEGLFHYTVTFSRTFDVAPDGRFLMVTDLDPEHAPKQVSIILNWPGLLLTPQP